MKAGALGIVVVAGAVLGQCASLEAQSPPGNGGIRNIDSLVAVVRAATERYRDPQAARRDGYHPIGPDAPAMGQHWVKPRLALSPALDPTRPAVLSYVEVGGVTTLVGAALLTVIGKDDPAPPWPNGALWHEHSGDLDEEGFGLSSMTAATGTLRAAMLHVWSWQVNPDGAVAADNWSLPFLRAGLEPPAAAEPDAARAVALLSNGTEYYSELLTRAFRPSEPARDAMAIVLSAARRDVETICPGDPSKPTPLDRRQLRDLRERWREVVEGLSRILPPGVQGVLEGHAAH